MAEPARARKLADRILEIVALMLESRIRATISRMRSASLRARAGSAMPLPYAVGGTGRRAARAARASRGGHWIPTRHGPRMVVRGPWRAGDQARGFSRIS